MKKYRKPHRVKKKKSIFRSRFFWLFILILIFLGGIFYLISFSSFFQIKEIKILGNQKISSETLENSIKKEIVRKIVFYNSKSIFLAQLNKIQKNLLKEYPQAARADLKRIFPDKISLKIEERKPIAIFCPARQNFLEENLSGQAEGCFFLDREGIIFEPSGGVSNGAGLPKIVGNIDSLNLGEKALESNYLEYILEIKGKLAENQKLKIKEFIPSEKKLIVVTAEGWQIFFDPQGNIPDQILNLNLVLNEKIPPEKRGNLEYIDLRFGNKAYLKYR
ncbi:FtsQ-type POTRA domain-containing protein [Patescibacteria group bacterium]|nr:FtsQ-type POTRA domain-containing protein [Patescibacteria group bacterium]MBU4481725.1 FtsQ-type POTRA domain-containing protein [Patescibacteria group bacterium]